MKLQNHLLFLGFFLLLLTCSANASESVSITRQNQKNVALIAYFPGENNCRGIAIISHGAGGSEKGYSYLGDAMSSMGYMTDMI